MSLSPTKALLLSATQAASRKMSQSTTKIIPSRVAVDEVSLPLQDGMVLAGQRWTYHQSDDENDDVIAPKHKIFALHGWMDNSASFHYLAPHLVNEMKGKAELIALDLPGHGLSSHKSLDGPPTLLSEGVYYVAEALEKLGWTTTLDEDDHKKHHDKAGKANRTNNTNNCGVTLVGHSMGGGLSIAYAAAYPEHVNKLVLLDSYSPLSGEHEKSVHLLRSHIESRKKSAKPNRVYESLEQAIQTRQMTAAKAPGKQWLSLEAATEMVQRATVPVDGGGYSFRHDTRLLWPSLQYFMPEQVYSILKSVQCPTCIIAAENGWPFKEDHIKAAVNLLQPRVHKILPGSHHLHADPDTAKAVLDEVYQFVDQKDIKYVI